MPRWTSTQYFLVSGKLFSFLTQSLVFPYDILIEDDGRDGPVTVVTDEQPKKHWKTKKQYPWSKKSFLTVNDVKDASNNSPGGLVLVFLFVRQMKIVLVRIQLIISSIICIYYYYYYHHHHHYHYLIIFQKVYCSHNGISVLGTKVSFEWCNIHCNTCSSLGV